MAYDVFESSQRRLLVLKKGKEGAVRNRHPWIFSGAIGRESGPEDAAIADLVDDRGSRIASGFHSRFSQIRLRVLTFENEDLTRVLLRGRLARAIQARAPLFDDLTNAARLIHSEGDDLSGIIVDRYDDVLVAEIANRGAEQLKPLIVETLQEELSPRLIYFKNDLPARKLEQLTTEADPSGSGGGAAGQVAGVPVVTIREHGLRFQVDPAGGQKTGFFLDQRDNRELCRGLAAGRRVLNLFSYSGAFGVFAAAGGANEVENVEVSGQALALARVNHELNGLSAAARFTLADVFQFVREKAPEQAGFDLVVCDPPAFAKSRADVEKAARGYKDVNLRVMRLIAPGGLLMTFSCSGHVSLDLFQKIIFSAALDAGRRVSFLRRLGAGLDHPTSLYCPESEYLKGFLLRVE